MLVKRDLKERDEEGGTEELTLLSTVKYFRY